MLFYLAAILFGILLGAGVNYGAAEWAWEPKHNNPWCFSTKNRPDWYKIPIIGWFGMRSESAVFGRGFWVRPLLVEAAMGAFSLWFFQNQVVEWVALCAYFEKPFTLGGFLTLLGRYAMQLVLAALMLAASLIDFDEKTIPDNITVSGTLFALAVSMFFPLTLSEGTLKTLGVSGTNGTSETVGTSVAVGTSGMSETAVYIRPVTQLLDVPIDPVEESGDELLVPLNAASPLPPLDVRRDEFSGYYGLVSALICWCGWCFALTERHWRMRRGWRWALRIFWARLMRTRSTRLYVSMGFWGSVLITAFWASCWPQWLTLWTSLVGMGIAGAFMWLIRIAGRFAMDREAMGFGDVTLMAMLGAFLGWQPCVVLFFIAPFAGLIAGIVFLIFFRDREIPFGPFLCMAALVTMLYWTPLWILTRPLFALGSLLVTLGLGCLLLMVILLCLIQGAKALLLGGRGEEE